jgi:uncharacterized membrane protein
MAFIGRLHPLLVHFPIALVLAAVAADIIASRSNDLRWRVVAARNLQAGAVSAVMAAVAGWSLALSTGIEPTALLDAHRWLGTLAAAISLAAAVSASRGRPGFTPRGTAYRTALWSAGVLVAAAAHLGGVLVWGADFLRP